MATTEEIRAWAIAQGLEVKDKGGLANAVKDAYAEYYAEDPPPDLPPDDLPEADPGPPPETRPRAVPGTARGPRNPLAGRFAKGKGKAKPKGRAKPRVPVSDMITAIWGGIGGMVGSTGLPATGRMVKLQAPVAGILLEDAVKGTVVDTWLQPLVRTSQQGEAMAALVLPPILVAAIEMNPERADFLLPILRGVMLRWAKIAGPRLVEQTMAEREFEEQFGETVDAMLAMIAGGPLEPAEPKPADTWDSAA